MAAVGSGGVSIDVDEDSAPAHDRRRGEFYAPTFEALSLIIRELERFRDVQSDTDAVRQTGVLLDAAHTLEEQLRQAMSRGAESDVELIAALLMGWDRTRAQLLALRPSELTVLSAREVQVLASLARGQGNKQIAQELGISARTARNHVSSIYEKLGVSGRAEAAVQAVRMGLLDS